jgi:polysaccharide biosynthesis transport protein
MSTNLKSLPTVIQRHLFPALATFAATIGASLVYVAVTPPEYEGSARLMLDGKQASVSELGKDLSQISSAIPGGASPMGNQAELIKSERVLKRALGKVVNQPTEVNTHNRLTTEKLNKGLKVKIVPATNILEINYKDKDPKLVAKVLNAVSEATVEESAEVVRREAANVRKFLEGEVPKQRIRLQAAEVNENNYRKNSGVVSFDEQTRSLVGSLASLEEQERTLVAQLEEIKSRDKSLRQITETDSLTQAYASVRGGQDKELEKLRGKLKELEAKVVEAKLLYTDNHPTLINLVEQRDAIIKLYNQELNRLSPQQQTIQVGQVAGDGISQELTSKLINNEVENLALKNKLKVIQSNLTKVKDNLAELPIKQQPLTALTRKREEALNSLKLLQIKLEEARIAEVQLVGNVRIIDLAQAPTFPTSPKLPIILLLGGVVGVILAAGIIVVLEVMDNTLRDASEAQEILKLPLLGVLPSLPTQTINLEPGEEFLDNVVLVEPYRMLLKNLQFRNSEELKVLVISSTIAGEGKSIVVSHLAAVSAMLSRRTLIIDADLRRPVQHQLFNLSQSSGVTDVICGHQSLMEAVQPTEIDNLSILTSGEIYDRPSQFLESQVMKSLVTEARENFDLVIIDTPPVTACADAATLSKFSDGMMIITRPSFTHKEAMQMAVSDLTHNHLPLLGIVVNGITSPAQKYYHRSLKQYQSVSSKSGFSWSRTKINDHKSASNNSNRHRS